jgi:SAM-dependent methyltransferase
MPWYPVAAEVGVGKRAGLAPSKWGNALTLIDYYDEDRWGALTGDRALLQREKKCLKIISRLKAKPKSILDVGCGDGLFLKHVEQALGKDCDLHGVDYSQYQLSKASELPFSFKQANIETAGLPYDSEMFDMVNAAELIEHLVNPDYFLEECWRILKPSGYLLISTPNLQVWYNRALFLLGIQPLFYEVSTKSTQIGAGPLKGIKKGVVPVGHIRIFNVRGLKDILESEGFAIKRVRAANFEALPGPVRLVDSAVNVYPRLASNLVVLGQKRQK